MNPVLVAVIVFAVLVVIIVLKSAVIVPQKSEYLFGQMTGTQS